MARKTPQMETWRGRFGREYTDRTPHTVEDVEELYIGRYGVGRLELNARFLGGLDRSVSILEAGSGSGAQLACLERMGFTNLCGLELQSYAIETAQAAGTDIEIAQGSVLEMPLENGQFDLVFTSGLLIHISPSDLPRALSEIHRCSRSLIWGFEYFADEPAEITYRGHDNLLWKRNFAAAFLGQFDDLVLVREERLKYRRDANVDSMYLIRKVARD